MLYVLSVMQIELYHREQQKGRESQLRDEQKRLQELKDKLHLQAVKDKERFESVLLLVSFTMDSLCCVICYRIKWREEKRLQKLEEKRIVQDKIKEEEKERERRLDKLKEKVQLICDKLYVHLPLTGASRC